MNKIILTACLLLSCRIVSGQILTVIDQVSLQPLAGTAITGSNSLRPLLTNSDGNAEISSMKGDDSISIHLSGYQGISFSFGQLEAMNFRISLRERSLTLDEIVISASRFEEKMDDIAQVVQVIGSKELRFMSQPNTADALQQSGNVLVQKSQLGGGSPLIRGFEANKILMVVDGVRMNNAIYRGGHLQNIITLDQTMLDKIEIVFGPGSVVYGSDALGGVMHFYTRNPALAGSHEKTAMNVNAFTRYSSASTEKTGHADINFGWKKAGFLSSLTLSDFGDLRQGGVRNPFYGDWGKRLWFADRIGGTDSMVANADSNLQIGSGYRQLDFFQKILFQQSEKITHSVNFQYSTGSDVPFYARLTQTSGSMPRFAEWYYGPQERIFTSYTFSLKNAQGLFENARIISAFQKISESRHDRRFGNNTLNNRFEDVAVLTCNADFEKKIKSNELRYGLEGTFNRVNSAAYTKDIATGAMSALDSRYPVGGSNMSSAAVYVTHAREFSPKWILNDGVRYSQISLKSQFGDTTFFPFPFDEVRQSGGALTGNIGLIFMPGEWRFAALASSGFRAPNVDDVAKVFESIPGSVIVPNPGLKPEYTYNGDFTISRRFGESVRITGNGYYTIYRNAISVSPSQFQGMDSIFYDGQMSQVTSSQNVTEAFIRGGSAGLQADAGRTVSISSTINYTYGRIKTDSTPYPLDHIPPVFGKTGITMKVQRFRAEFFVMYNGWKRLKDYNMFGEDNFANATENGTPAWTTLNVRATYNFTKSVQLQAALENIGDVNYRVFASGISGAGRNLVVTVRGSF